MHSVETNSEKKVGPGNLARLILRLAVLMLVGIAVVSLAVAQSPQIKSVSKITTQQYQTIVIRGSGFGTMQPYTGDSGSISLWDLTRGWQGGYAGSYWGGYTQNAVTLIVDSWEDNKITLGGFSGFWGQYNWTLARGDVERIDVWNAQSGNGPASVEKTVIGEVTETTIILNPNPSTHGQPVTLTALVNSGLGAPPDGETVSLMQGPKLLGTGTLSGGWASFTTATLSVGTHSITAVYPGDADFDNSKSQTVQQIVVGW